MCVCPSHHRAAHGVGYGRASNKKPTDKDFEKREGEIKKTLEKKQLAKIRADKENHRPRVDCDIDAIIASAKKDGLAGPNYFEGVLQKSIHTLMKEAAETETTPVSSEEHNDRQTTTRRSSLLNSFGEGLSERSPFVGVEPEEQPLTRRAPAKSSSSSSSSSFSSSSSSSFSSSSSSLGKRKLSFEIKEEPSVEAQAKRKFALSKLRATYLRMRSSARIMEMELTVITSELDDFKYLVNSFYEDELEPIPFQTPPPSKRGSVTEPIVLDDDDDELIC